MYTVTAKRFIDSVARRTTVLCGTFDTLDEAAAYAVREFGDDLLEGEEVILARDVEV